MSKKQKFNLENFFDEFSFLSSRLELLSVLLASNGDNLPPLFSSRDSFRSEVRFFVADELERIAFHIRSEVLSNEKKQ